MLSTSYPSDLTDPQWALLEPKLRPVKRGLGRPPADARTMINGILYVLRGGIPWRFLPKGYGPWQTVYGTFRRWKAAGLWEVLNTQLRGAIRRAAGKRARPTGCILDSQTVRSADHGGQVGYDAAKKTKGRKRHLLVDTLGLILGVWITPASTPERAGAEGLLSRVLLWFSWLKIMWVDGGYTGPAFADWVRTIRPKLKVEVVRRCDDGAGFQVLPRRWVVERTFGWLMKQRRLVRDYEQTESSATAMVYIAMIRIMLRRLA
jgi:putative transposase